MQSLRQQLAEFEHKQASSSTKSDDVSQLQAEVGRMKTELKKKVCISMTFVVLTILCVYCGDDERIFLQEDSICELEMRLSSKQAEHDSVQERLANSDMMVS